MESEQEIVIVLLELDRCSQKFRAVYIGNMWNLLLSWEA